MSPFEPLQLPNGQVLVNRIAKAAMEENMADAQQAPSRELKQLYQAWADGEPGLLLTGNVMIDRRAMTGPGGVALEDERSLDSFREWAAVGRNNGGHFWVQLNHPGRQTPANLRQQALAPSAVALDLGIFSKMFAKPRAMSEDEIQNVITRFATSARLAEKAGFTGVQIHAAHGYLLSQFLSPLSNRRTDHWGGSLQNRARLLIEVIKAVRASVSPSFCVGVKLNSADFQRGGFDADDARARASADTGPRLLALARDGNLEEARALLGSSSAGVTAADVDEDGLTALHFAADRGHVALAALLLARGAPLEARDSDGLTPLATAVLSEAEEMVRFLLLEHDANPDAADGDGVGVEPLVVPAKRHRWRQIRATAACCA